MYAAMPSIRSQASGSRPSPARTATAAATTANTGSGHSRRTATGRVAASVTAATPAVGTLKRGPCTTRSPKVITSMPSTAAAMSTASHCRGVIRQVSGGRCTPVRW